MVYKQVTLNGKVYRLLQCDICLALGKNMTATKIVKFNKTSFMQAAKFAVCNKHYADILDREQKVALRDLLQKFSLLLTKQGKIVQKRLLN